MIRSAAGPCAEAAAWWAGLCGLYLCLITTITPGEIALAAGIAAAAAAAAVAGRRAARLRLRPDRSAARYLAWVPFDQITDAARVPVTLLRGTPGGCGFRHATMPAARDETAAATSGRLAIAMLAIGLSPGTYVVDTAGRRMLLHALSDRPSRAEAVIGR